MIGFVIQEKNNHGLIHLARNKNVYLQRGTYSQERKTPSFPDFPACSQKITQLWPFCVWVLKNGDVKITLNCSCVDEFHMNVPKILLLMFVII